MYTKTIPRHPTDHDKTLREVLDDVIGQNALNGKLVEREVKAKEVILTYEEPS